MDAERVEHERQIAQRQALLEAERARLQEQLAAGRHLQRDAARQRQRQRQHWQHLEKQPETQPEPFGLSDQLREQDSSSGDWSGPHEEPQLPEPNQAAPARTWALLMVARFHIAVAPYLVLAWYRNSHHVWSD